MNKILHGDALEILRTLPDESVHSCVTSPPYWGLRDYGVEGQLGLEKTPEEFVQKMVEVFREVKRVLRSDGTLWLNIGDSYAAGGNGGGTAKQESNRGTRALKGKPKKAPPGLKPKDLVGIPWMLAFALRADGWYLRQDIIWHKPNPMPESVQDRCTKAHEYVFLMAKSRQYYFDYEAIKEEATSGRDDMAKKGIRTGLAYLSQENVASNSVKPSRPAGWATGKDHSAVGWNTTQRRKKFDKTQAGGGTNIKGHSGNLKPDGTPFGFVETGMKNKRSVWSVTPKAFKEAHFATFPEKLIEPMILAGTPPGGIVLDPFMGAGTTGLVAKKLGRNYLGIELNLEYIKIAERRIGNVPDSLFKV